MQIDTSSQFLIRTKLYRPRFPSKLVNRPRLLERLGRRQFTFVVAPAGYGKTTLLSTWLETCGRPNAWLSLDKEDSEFARFLTYCVAAVRGMFASIGEQTLSLVTAPVRTPVHVISQTFINELDTIEQDFVLVLDDYHLINDLSIHRFLAGLLHHPPHCLHLVISTRHDPPLPLARLRASLNVNELRADDLRFTEAETVELVQQDAVGPVDQQMIAMLAETTEGWVASLHLAVLYLRQAREVATLKGALGGNNRNLMDFLTAEVLSQLKPAIRAFFIASSILDRLCGPLCDAVVDPQGREGVNSRQMLRWLEETGIFMVALDDRNEWYRVHHLVQKLLQHQLRCLYPVEVVAELHLRASAWCDDHDLVEEALHHALDAGSIAAAVAVIARHRHKLMDNEEWRRLERWLSLFTMAVIQQNPELLLLDAWLCQYRSDSVRINHALERVESFLAELSPDAPSYANWQGEVEALRSQQYAWAADAVAAVQAAQCALALISPERQFARSFAYLHLAAGHQTAGDLDLAYACLADALCEVPKTNATAYLKRYGLGLYVQYVAADLPGMRRTAAIYRDMAPSSEFPVTIAWSHYFWGCADYLQNDLAGAAEHFGAVVARRYQSHALTFVQSSFGLALTYQAQELPEKATETVELAAAFLTKMNEVHLLPLVEAFLAELCVRQGKIDVAVRWVEEMGSAIRLTAMPMLYAAQMTAPKVWLAVDSAGSRRAARTFLARMHSHVTQTHNTRFLIETLAMQALLYNAEGRQPEALVALERAIGLAQPGGHIRVFADLGFKLDPLLANLEQRQVASTYVAQIRAALQATGAGRSAVVTSATAKTPDPFARRRSKDNRALVETLTFREMDILNLLGRRLSNKEIAHELSISTETVKQHTVSIFRKLRVDNRRKAIVAAGIGNGPSPDGSQPTAREG